MSDPRANGPGAKSRVPRDPRVDDPNWRSEASAEPVTSFTEVAPYYDELMRDVPYGLWINFVLHLASRHRVSPRRILDLACGTGTVSLLLAERGLQVAGVDGSEAMLAVARRKAAERSLAVPFYHSDLRKFSAAAVGEPEPFDLAICLYDSLNNILEPEGLQQAFEGVASALAPGALFIFDLNTEFALRANLFTQEDTSAGADVQYCWQSQYDAASGLCTVEMRFWVKEGEGRRYFREIHRQRAYDEAELQQLLSRAGLRLEDSYDGLSLRPPSSTTDRVYVVARRTEAY